MNGQWDFAFDDENIGVLEGWSHTVRGDRKINVPFTYETGKSGIGDERPHGVIWYWKNITITNEFKKDQSIQINFEGCDYHLDLWVNGVYKGSHDGAWIMQNGGDFWNEDQTKFVLTSPEAKEAWQKLVDLVTVEKVTDTKHITAKMPTEQYFFANKAAQLVKGSWASAVGDDLENENWKYVFMPPVKGDIPYFAVESGWGYVVSENSKNKDTAWDFVKYCMEPENAKEFNLGTGTVASLKAIIDDEGYQSDERNVRVSDQYQYLQYARSVGPVQDMDFVKKTLLDTFTKAASGSIGTDEALEEMETSINNHIQELLKQAK